MVNVAAAGNRTAWRGRLGTEPVAARPSLDARRALQLVLAAIWLLDGVLQYQGFMFTPGFNQMLAGTADGNPAIIAKPITWDATLIGHHLVALNAIFATIQLLLGLGIAFRPTVKIALAASILWSLGVWWFGEGLGGVLNGGASPLNGAPGAVILYALAAVLLWPADRPGTEPGFVAGRAVGAPVARVLWLVLWGSLAYFAVTPENRGPQGLHDMIAGMADGEPGWVAAIERNAAALFAHEGLPGSIILAVVLGVIAIGVFLPAPVFRPILVLALVTAAFIWVVGQAFGEIMAGGATDPNSGPLLALIALAYWPLRTAAGPARAAGRPLADYRTERTPA